MTYTLELVRRMQGIRASMLAVLILVLASCNTADTPTEPGIIESAVIEDSDITAGAEEGAETIAIEPTLSNAYAGGIPMGLFQTPASVLGGTYNGTLRIIYPGALISELKAIKARGGKVILNLAGAPERYRTRSGYFSISMWKASVDRYRNVNFSSFVQDGTIIGNYLIDEPNSSKRWGKPVSPSTIEEMARYSKARWPGMVTLARVRPDYLGSSHRALDAAWSQYHSRFGDPGRYIAHDAAVARNKGLALLTGMNVLDGNGGNKMSASQVKSWGSALLSHSHICAFVSWTYNSSYLSTTAMKDAMRYLRSRAQSRSTKSCRS
jgi:hypothetical protein